MLRAEKAIEKLKERAAAAQSQDMQREQIVEVVTSREVERRVFEQMQGAAQHECLFMTRAPLRISRLDVPPEKDARVQREAQIRGVRYRNIVDTMYVGLTGAVERIRSDAEAGEKIRLFSGVPLKMLIADRRIAIVPLQLQQPDGPSLIVRHSALLDALCALFEVLWERAAPVSFTIAGTVETGVPASQSFREVEELISLMAAGLNDKKIAGELGISMRTLRRRAAELMKNLNARTRFQAGWFAARQQYERQGN
ncbi:MAG: LuxR C-terminal-related transcriptional regulator [Terriglobia bacterium]